MARAKPVYKMPEAGVPLITKISTDCRTPILEIKFCNLFRPFYYPNSPHIPRYSVTCQVDPKENQEFLNGIHSIEVNEKVDTILKNETVKENDKYVNTGKILVKFQTKNIIPVYYVNEKQEEELIPLEEELADGERIVIIYDILRFTKRNTAKLEHGLSFQPSKIYYYPKED